MSPRAAERFGDLMRQGFWKGLAPPGTPNRFADTMAKIRVWEAAHGRRLVKGDPDFPWERNRSAEGGR